MRRLKKAQITFISLCPRGMNGFRTVFKSDGDAFELHPIIKGFDEARGELTAVVYAPDIPDLEGDLADCQVIKDAAYEYMRDHRNVDVRHNLQPLAKTQAYLAESFIIAKGDERFADFKDANGTPRDVTGGWATVFKIEDADLRAKYASGEWAGVSMFGSAITEQVTKADDQVTDDIVARVAKRLGLPNPKEDDDMKPEELEAILKKQNENLVTLVKEHLKPPTGQPKETEKPKDDAPKFEEARPMPKAFDREGLATYAKELRAWEIRKAAFEGTLTVEQVAKMVQELSEPEVTDDQAGIEKEDSTEVRELKRKLFKMQNASGQRAGESDNGDGGGGDTYAGLSKEDCKDAKLADDLAAYVNGTVYGIEKPAAPAHA